MVKSPVRNLVLVLGDQLDADGAAFDGFDAKRDRVLMSEVTEEASYVPQHAQRLVLFFSAMRHLRAELEGRGCTVLYGALDDKANTQTLTGELERRVRTTYPERVVLCQPGDHRVLSAIKVSTDGGIVGSTPYCASGNYISRMSNYCKSCRYNPGQAVGEDACPFTTLYWDFLSRNDKRLRGNRRMAFQFKNLDRKSTADCRDIKRQATKLKTALTTRTYL